MKVMLQLAKSEAFYCSLVKKYISLLGKIDLLSFLTFSKPTYCPSAEHGRLLRCVLSSGQRNGEGF